MSFISKADLILQVENKSSRDVERHLLSLSSEINLPKEKVRAISSDLTEIKLILNGEQKQRLDQLKLLLSHVNPNMTYQDLIDHLCLKALKQMQPKAERNETVKIKTIKINLNLNHSATLGNKVLIIEEGSAEKTQVRSRYISASTEAKVYGREEGCCSFIHPQSQKKCESKFQIQIDHIKPFALSGSNDESNLRLLCSSHNRFRSEKTFGPYSPNYSKSQNNFIRFQR